MTAREWLDAVEARQTAAAAPPPHWNYRQQVAWDRARSQVVKADVPALVAALRAVLDLCDGAESYDRTGWVGDLRAVIDTHLGGAS